MKYFLLLSSVLIAGCQGSGRDVSGTFTVDGEPMAGVQVYLPTDVGDFTTCGNAPLAATTNNAGEFHARASKFPVRPCFIVNGVTYSTFFIVDDGTKEPIHLSCNLPLVVTGHFEDGQICHSRRK